MEMLTVSVIVPNYNNEKYIAKCIDSILVQSYPIQKIVIYDDCSTDHSREILKEYAQLDSRVEVIYGEKNVGVSVARDIAIKATASDYVCMLDGDDYFYDLHKIENEMKKAQEVLDSTGRKVVVFSQTVDVDENGETLENVKHVDLNGNERFRIVTRLYSRYMPRDYCFPRKLYDKCGGYTSGLSLYEDWDLNIKLLGETDFIYSGGYGTAYRHKCGGLSSVNYKKHLSTKIKIFKCHKTRLKEKLVFYSLAFAAYIKHLVRG